MSNTCWTSCDSKNSVTLLCRNFCLWFIGELFCFSCVNNRDEFFRSFCGFKLCGKIFMHQKLHKSCKYFKMNITVCCCGNHKEQLTGLTVGRVIIYTVWNCDSREGGSFYSFALGMGNCNLHTYGCCAEFFTVEDSLFVGFNILEVSALFM